MKKVYYLIATLVLVIIFASASSNISSDSRIGNAAPNFTIGNNDEVVTLNQFRGKYVLLNIWSSADAESRLENMRLNKMVAGSDKVVQMAVNFDRSRALFSEVITADSLDISGQFYCEVQDRAQFHKKWGTDDQSYCTFLINDKGVVVAVNPSIKELAKVVR